MKILFDLHTHTLFSSHAYSTVYENIVCAKENGLLGLGITDHGVDMVDAGHEWHFLCLKDSLPDTVDGVVVLCGVEANIRNDNGELDIEKSILDGLDTVIASVHGPIYAPDNEKSQINTFLNVIENPNVNILGHIDRCHFEYDYTPIVKKAIEYNVAVELNQHSLQMSDFYRKNAVRLAKVCNKLKAPVVVNTDSHFCKSVGIFDDSLKMLSEVGFDKNLIINADYNKTMEWFCK